MSHTIIINFGGQPWQVEALKQRVNSSGINQVQALDLSSDELTKDLDQEKVKILEQINDLSKVYIIDHGQPNSPCISSAHYQDLAKFLAKHIKSEKVQNKQSKLKISLIACNAATGKGGVKSFAGLFHRYLGQECKIYCQVQGRNEVVMVNERTGKEGKFTTSLVDYALMTVLYTLPKIVYDANEHMVHQKPGTKLAFVWDENGDEWVVDAYIDKFFQRVTDIVSNINKNERHTINKDLLNKLVGDILEIISKRENQTAQNVEKLNNLLIILGSEVKNENNDIFKMIESAICFSTVSINENSSDPINTMVNFHNESLEGEKDIEKLVRSKIINQPIELLKKMPKTDLEKPFKKSCTNLLQSLSNCSTRKLKKEEGFSREEKLSKIIEDIILVISDKELSFYEKLKKIDLLEQQMEEESFKGVIFSPAISGVIEGLADAYQLGGLSGLGALLPLVRYNSGEVVRELEEINKKQTAFIFEAILYLHAMHPEEAASAGTALEVSQIEAFRKKFKPPEKDKG